MGQDLDAQIIDLLGLANAGGSGAIYSQRTEDLDVNLVRFGPGSGVGRHVNRELDVLLVVVEGEGALIVEGTEHRLRPSLAIIIPKGAAREIRVTGPVPLVYLTVHQRRRRLWPKITPQHA